MKTILEAPISTTYRDLDPDLPGIGNLVYFESDALDHSATEAGVVNRGDSFRRRRSRSNSLVPPGQQQHPEGTAPPPQTPVASPAAGLNNDIITYRVAMIGASGVGKTALVSQFMTSECINAYDRQRGG
uniref:Uncharacterized protein n=1 Tax=Timema tahoe TaxID=61484 RepID=A0A7R9FHL8_9NEOP|nr:unnamed protein product [Timema tahoe]